jgi:hypothetical protein
MFNDDDDDDDDSLSWKSSQNLSTLMLFLVMFARLKNSRTWDYIVEKTVL